MNKEKEGEPRRKNFAMLFLVFLVAKASKLVKLTKLFKLAKPIVMVVSMSLSAIVYAFFMGPWFSIGLIAMLFIHEMGHVVALHIKGYKVNAPVFIPFLGAAIFVPPMQRRDEEAFVGIGGPLIGGIAAVLVFAGWLLVKDKESPLAVILLMVSYIGLSLNIFNLIPISPLDGGRITQAVGPWFKYVGIAILCGVTILIKEPVILFLWLMVIPEITIFPMKVRLVFSIITWTTMIVLMWLGFSSQPLVADLMDCFLGVILVLGNIMNNENDPCKLATERPQLLIKQRVAWFIYYTLLLVLLFVVMMWQVPLLPKPPTQ